MTKWREKPNEDQMKKTSRKNIKKLRKQKLDAQEQPWINDQKSKKDGNWMN